MKTLLILLVLFTGTVNAQTTDEQIAVDYFFENILPKEKVKVKFSGKTESETSGTIFFPDCLTKSEISTLYKDGGKESTSIPINAKDYIKKSNKNHVGKYWSMYVCRSIKISKNTIVVIELVKKQLKINYYYLILDENSKVVNWCVVRGII